MPGGIVAQLRAILTADTTPPGVLPSSLDWDAGVAIALATYRSLHTKHEEMVVK